MILDSTTKQIRAYLGGAVTTNQLECNAIWADHDPLAPSFTGGHESPLTNGTTPVVLIDSPAAGIRRHAKGIWIFNADTVAATVFVEVYDGTNRRKWIRAELAPNYSLAWEPGGTWHVYDDTGVLQGTGGGGAALTVEEADGSPSYGSITTLQVNQGDGLTLTQPSAGVARISSSGTPAPDEEAQLLAWLGI